jgi:hypothetical protein
VPSHPAALIAELNRVVTWKWLERTATPSAERNVMCDLSPANWDCCSMVAAAMMEIPLAIFELVNPRPPYPETWDTLADVPDVPIWAAAVEGRAQYIVANNRRDYPPRQEDGRHIYQGVEYLSGADVLGQLTST